MPLITCADDVCRYVIEVPDGYPIHVNTTGADRIEVPCPFEPGETMTLQDEFLIEAARDGDFGLRLISETPLAGQDARPTSAMDGPP